MKTRFVALTLAACVSFATHTVLAQNYATVPVGFIKTTVPVAPSASTPSTAIIGVPFYSSPNGSSVYAGGISAVTSSTISIATTGTWATSQFTSGAPHLARIKTAANSSAAGLFFLITANTDSQITVATRGLNLSNLLVGNANDTFEIVQANTLGSAFGTQPPTPASPAGTSGVVSLMSDDLYPATHTTAMIQTAASTSDNVLVFDSATSSWTTYFFYSNPSNANFNVPNGSGIVTNPAWHTSGGGLATSPNQNNVIIYPDEAVFIRHRSTTKTVDLVFSGSVPSTQEQSDLRTPASTLLANRFPTDTTLLGLGLHNVSNWQKGTAASTTDNVLIFDGTNWTTYFYYNNPGAANYNDNTGKNPAWHTSGGGLSTSPSQNAVSIPAGSAVFVRRISTAPDGATTSLTQSLPYSLN